MIDRRGDLALVPIPSADLSSAKRQPVLVLPTRTATVTSSRSP